MTIREVAAQAGVSPALVMKVAGSKEQLWALATPPSSGVSGSSGAGSAGRCTSCTTRPTSTPPGGTSASASSTASPTRGRGAGSPTRSPA
ncbi:hypothetical protein DV701_02770 [Ornithinimicrobium avium]|uniref:Uncharacterized protein n=1 Tax=Ornithinimicrobium avium TaxID=2283195 RepID=A0A345NJJ8_9MICO|nr:hypothetical protein DV701_02770 [Ornithinimicrobium avium]